MADPQKVFTEGEYRPLKTSENQPAKECCCTPPEDCCLYPANPEVAGDLPYPFTDLPATLDITYEGILYAGATKNDFGFGLVAYTHPSYLSGTEPLLGHSNGSGAWSFGDDGGGGSMPCLVGEVNPETFSEDTFPDPLNSEFEGTPYELHRNTLCYWSGTVIHEGDEYVSDIYYMDEAPAFPPTDFYGNPWPTKPFWMFILGVGTLDQFFAKDDPQDAPTGTYGSGAITVT